MLGVPVVGMMVVLMLLRLVVSAWVRLVVPSDGWRSGRGRGVRLGVSGWVREQRVMGVLVMRVTRRRREAMLVGCRMLLVRWVESRWWWKPLGGWRGVVMGCPSVRVRCWAGWERVIV